MNQMTVNTEPVRVTERLRENRTRPLRWILPLVVMGAGAIGGMALLGSGPQAPMAPPATQPRIVEVATFTAGTQTPVFEAMGTVIAAHESTLYPMVSGPIVAVSDQLMPGGRFKAGQEMLRIDEADYRLSLRKQQASVSEAQAALWEEMGQQAVAKREYELLDRNLEEADKALVLRAPQLESARATLASARANRDQADLDLARTRVTAPFDGMVLSRDVDLGTRVTTSTPLLTLINVDTFWVEVSVPVAYLSRIAIPGEDGDTGAQVELHQTGWGAAQTRHGRVLRLIPELDSASRTARLLVEIDDPLALREENAGLPPIMVNDYLRVRIDGEALPEVVKLPRNLLRDGDTVWIMNDENQLEIRPVDVVHKAGEHVLIKAGIDRDDRIITVDLSTPVAGMLLRLLSEDMEDQQQLATDASASRRETDS
ncbi:MAG: efflux RND transporter periplasmic adaptor subunit [Proteobacteria bacterium]|nr:MAG: efflux RND transporter periplasmic adaptor subunit [Pseudomonadota bacterium]